MKSQLRRHHKRLPHLKFQLKQHHKKQLTLQKGSWYHLLSLRLNLNPSLQPQIQIWRTPAFQTSTCQTISPESDDPFVDKQYRMMKNVEENSRELKRMDDIIDVLQNILEKLLYRITETGPLDCNLIKNSLRRQQKRVKHHPSL